MNADITSDFLFKIFILFFFKQKMSDFVNAICPSGNNSCDQKRKSEREKNYKKMMGVV